MAAKPSKRVLGGREKVKVAIVQKSPAFMNRDASVARACTAIEEAGSNGADLVVMEISLSRAPRSGAQSERRGEIFRGPPSLLQQSTRWRDVPAVRSCTAGFGEETWNKKCLCTTLVAPSE
jgi:hypothetical protein